MKLCVRPAGAFLVVAAVSACDIPTGVPRWETTWVTPGEEITVSVVELLPAGLTVTPDSSAFVLELAPVVADLELGDFCAPCAGFGGTVTTDKPAFSGSASTSIPLAAGVSSVVIQEGQIDVQLTNGFGFDPINPSATADGTLTVTLLSGATTVGQLVLDGATQSFAPDTTLDLSIPLLAVEIADDFEVEITLDSPAGDSATMSASDALTLSISSPGIEVSEATVDLGAQPIDQAVELDLSGVDLGDRINEGTLFLDITNPFGVTGNLFLTIEPEDGAPIVKPVTLAAGDSEVQVTFDRAEIEQIVGRSNSMTISGTVNGTDVTIAPDMEIGVETRLRVTVEVGGSDDDGDGDED